MGVSSTSGSLLILLAAVAHAQKSGNTKSNQQPSSAAQPTPNTPPQPSQNTQSASNLPNSGSAAATSPGSSSATAAASSLTITDAPSITTTLPQFSLTGSLPTIAGVGPVTQIVPDTAKAPFMQKSNLPEGSVFIIVGAFLGFMGLAILAWRGVIAWSLHRSVRRAARREFSGDPKAGEKTKSVYGSGPLGPSTLSLDRLNPSHKPASAGEPQSRLSRSSHGHHSSRHHHHHHHHLPAGANPAAARNSNLFFSPTAGAGTHTSATNTPSPLSNPGNRSSTYLPAGFYSSPSASGPANGAATTYLGGAASIDPPLPSRLSHLNPLGSGAAARAGYAPQRNFGPSPPASPSLMPTRKSGEDLRRYGDGAWSASPLSAGSVAAGRASMQNQESRSTLGVAGVAERAPSTNLEELFEVRGGGGAKERT